MAPTFLLDTHVVLWWFGGHARLDAEIREEVGTADSQRPRVKHKWVWREILHVSCNHRKAVALGGGH